MHSYPNLDLILYRALAWSYTGVCWDRPLARGLPLPSFLRHKILS